jgi:hypothetical protein
MPQRRTSPDVQAEERKQKAITRGGDSRRSTAYVGASGEDGKAAHGLVSRLSLMTAAGYIVGSDRRHCDRQCSQGEEQCNEIPAHWANLQLNHPDEKGERASVESPLRCLVKQ